MQYFWRFDLACSSALMFNHIKWSIWYYFWGDIQSAFCQKVRKTRTMYSSQMRLPNEKRLGEKQNARTQLSKSKFYIQCRRDIQVYIYVLQYLSEMLRFFSFVIVQIETRSRPEGLSSIHNFTLSQPSVHAWQNSSTSITADLTYSTVLMWLLDWKMGSAVLLSRQVSELSCLHNSCTSIPPW